MIVITGATGHIGKKISEILLKKGKQLKVIARNKENLKELENHGAEPLVASLDDAVAMTAAFSEADAVFTLIPPNYTAENFREYQNKIGKSLAESIKNSKVKYVVNLSSIGAQLPDKTGPIAGLHENEERFNALPDVNILHLRPTYFLENFLRNASLMKNMGMNGTPIKPDLKIPMIATKDIAAEAAARLDARDFHGKSVKELLGQRDVSMQEVTSALGKAIGHPNLKYVQFSYEDAEKAMVGMGLSPDLARLYIEMNRGFNEGIIRGTQPRGPATTTPTSLEEFAKEFAVIAQTA